jgi:hypothetical protein
MGIMQALLKLYRSEADWPAARAASAASLHDCPTDCHPNQIRVPRHRVLQDLRDPGDARRREAVVSTDRFYASPTRVSAKAIDKGCVRLHYRL